MQAFESIFVAAFYLVSLICHFLHTLNKNHNLFGARTANLTGNQNQLSRLLFFIIAYAVTLHCIEPQVCVRIELSMPLQFMK